MLQVSKQFSNCQFNDFNDFNLTFVSVFFHFLASFQKGLDHFLKNLVLSLHTGFFLGFFFSFSVFCVSVCIKI